MAAQQPAAALGALLPLLLLAMAALQGAAAIKYPGLLHAEHCISNRMHAALTFDDGPYPKETPAILDVLKRNGVKARCLRRSPPALPVDALVCD
jgi:peptidoglycan/xylan/chitin deacetylase (PgdA/CDA1 family)